MAALQPLHLLFLFDSKRESQAIANHLEFSGLELAFHSVTSTDLLAMTLGDRSWDLVIIDMAWTALEPEEAINFVQLRAGNVPILLMNEVIGEGELRKAAQLDVRDLIAKDDLARLTFAIKREARDLAAQENLEATHQELAHTNSRLQDSLRLITRTQEQMLEMERNRVRGEMAENVERDLMSVLATIMGQVELLGDSARLQHIKTLLDDAGRVIGDLRNSTTDQPETPQASLIDLSDLVTEMLEANRPYWQARAEEGLPAIQLDLQTKSVPKVRGNTPQLREALSHLMFNACDAMSEGGELRMSTFSDRGSVVLEVRDSGRGMSEEVRQQCTTPFFSTKQKRCAGLGLSLAKSIIGSTGGSLEIHSEPGRGTTITVRIPSAEEIAGENTSRCHLLRARPAMQRLEILLVDDDPQIAGILARYLQTEGHRVDSVYSGADGLRRSRNRSYDVVISDSSMLGMSGVELATAIKEQNPEMPVVLATGFGMTVKGTMPSVVDYLLTKPISRDCLREALYQVVTKKAIRMDQAA